MQPSSFVVLAEFPVNANGKIDRAALPAPETSRPDLGQEFVAPRNPQEKQLADILVAGIGSRSGGIHDNFFDLGGASIQTLEVVDRAAEVDVALSPEMIFQYQTVAELAAAGQSTDTLQTVPPPTANAPQPAVAKIKPQTESASVPEKLADTGRMVIESLGVYLPANVLSTDEVIQGCSQPLDFPLEHMTGIKQRHVVEEHEFSIDLASKAIEDCLRPVPICSGGYRSADLLQHFTVRRSRF